MTQKALKLALEALGAYMSATDIEEDAKAHDLMAEAFFKIKEALAQPEQEPDWYHGVDKHGCNRFYHKTEARTSEFNTPLYTTPPKREWVGLTDEEIAQGCKESWVTEQAWQSAVWWAEAKLKVKNYGRKT